MLFNSFEFAIFLPIVFSIYWFVLNRHLRLQNLFLVIASYTFYGWWDWRFLGLIFLNSIVDYTCGLMIHRNQHLARRKLWLSISLIQNLGFLCFFKYFNFFMDNLMDVASLFGWTLHLSLLKVILPLGISFYTFQTMSYVIDVYRNRLNPAKDIIEFLAFISFFPQLLAGPIERAERMLPQFARTRTFDHNGASKGMRLILWGLFKKVVIADSCASSVEYIFSNQASLNGITLWIGAVYFAFQIYGDFSGYSDMARGLGQLFGIRLMRNFTFPYFSTDIRQFWQRWHISLSTWFRDYVYIPLGGNRCGRFRHIANVMATFSLSGFWHGANWTFVLWGVLHGAYQIPLLLTQQRGSPILLPLMRNAFAQIAFTFLLTSMAWILFRSNDIGTAISYYHNMFTLHAFNRPIFPKGINNHLYLILAFVALEWVQKDKPYPLSFDRMPVAARWVIYLIFTLWIFDSFVKPQSFIYFQF